MTYVVVARYRTKDGAQDTVLPLLDTVAAASRREPGNLAYRVHQGTEDPRAVVLYEEYASEADFTAHCATEHFQEIVLGKVVPLLESRDVLRCAPRPEVGA
ncbi:antibiotic biosynthesis monooxygenase family protein [Streptomyces sp. NPDC007076]|uniref:putative quinol monooxygenase n=1 Tax=unclassified Streptomyces TaxID=2593676 RepID=UPI002E79336C|nr:antibiotic biosynthesis monooxygenase family protein [Streptomyces sp. JV190]MEE1845539.1 antibiotic biosynthesis monooxygenase [Streptomyces sp. JV190]